MTRIKIAIQKSGRLNKESINLLKECGININNGKDQLRVIADNYPIELLYLRNSDIPAYIEDGVADIGIVGENVIIEKQKKVDIINKLGFAKCRLSLAIPKNELAKDLSYFQGKKIATSYPNTLRDFLNKNNITADIHTISGSVEIAPSIGLSQAICDLVSSGSTLFKNGLVESQVILKSEAVLAANQSLSNDKKEILEELNFRINSVLNAGKTKYVLMNVPNTKISEVSQLLPVLKSPTVLPLLDSEWSSLHTVIPTQNIWDNISKLRNAGATDILIIPIEKMIR